MKILIAGHVHERASERWMSKALKSLGYDVDVFDYVKYKYMFGTRTTLKFKPLGLFAYHIANSLLVKYVKKYKPDILIVIKGDIIFPKTITKIKKMSVVTCNWFPDEPCLLNKSIKFSPFYDYFFSYDKYSIKKHIEAGSNAFYLPFSSNTDINKAAKITKSDYNKYKCDISFSGAMIGSNGKYMGRDKILESVSDFDLNVWGAGWNSNKISANVRRHYKGILSFSEIPKLYAASNIVLNMHNPFDGPGFGANGRVFDVSACKEFQICEYKKDIPNLFEIGSEIVCYKNVEELISLVEYYLEHPAKRMEIATRAYRRFKKDHTPKIRMKQMMSIINECK